MAPSINLRNFLNEWCEFLSAHVLNYFFSILDNFFFTIAFCKYNFSVGIVISKPNDVNASDIFSIV